MKKDEAERAIRILCHDWRRETGQSEVPALDLHFNAFWAWMKDRHFQYTDFRATAGAAYMAEIWFDQEFGLTWTR
ncbi:hypothetical protein [Methylobacterium sp. WL6]|uniref:hypothetical protein n=1 Tax=Methylobacterium sp. WL6 TaxID=2603901 RepID=UPI0011C7F3F9|nr:hypothetical protein [Methylobacterium sp. WL6]TXN73416.1 hypothetical protein FV230_01195 [Methylobacterium sp. WL6]